MIEKRDKFEGMSVVYCFLETIPSMDLKIEFILPFSSRSASNAHTENEARRKKSKQRSVVYLRKRAAEVQIREDDSNPRFKIIDSLQIFIKLMD